MGNKLCKEKTDTADHTSSTIKTKDTSPSKFDRIINRLRLKPTSWKSDSHLNQKQANRLKDVENKKYESKFYTSPLSKSSDFLSKEDDCIHLRNPELSLIFDKENGTPTPPPRKHQNKSNFRGRLEKIAKNGLQVLQDGKKPVEEPLMVKKKINYNCPVCDRDEKSHNRNHNHDHLHTDRNSPKQIVPRYKKDDSIKKIKDSKGKKNLSVVSLPNYTDLKFSVTNLESLKEKQYSKSHLNSSRLSLQDPCKKNSSKNLAGKLDSCITRCRSLGSLFPQHLKKLNSQRTSLNEEILQDDLCGALEDWDIGLIEHYNPKDASLSRSRKSAPQNKNNNDVLSGIESLIIKEEKLKDLRPPVRSESLVKRIDKTPTTADSVTKGTDKVCLTLPLSSVSSKKGKELVITSKVEYPDKGGYKKEKPSNVTQKNYFMPLYQKEEPNDKIEHSSLMKILQECSVKDKKEEKSKENNVLENDRNVSSLTPSVFKFEKNLNSNVEDFINAEKNYTEISANGNKAVFS